MIYAAVLAGGTGNRMGNVDKPKQFLHIGKKPIIIHTVEKLIINERFDKVIVLCPEQWMTYTKDILSKYLPGNDAVVVTPGGDTRNGTILNAVNYIEENYGLDDETVLVTHDAVRPFVTQRIIDENIDSAVSGTACDTVVPAADTIVESIDGKFISNIPNRAYYNQGQTPQSFRAKRFRELYESLTDEERSILTDACKVFVVKGEPVAIIRGETFNIKVTYPYDLQLAETLLGGDR
ncbi:MAG: 2-C-methyl-D-erythritol 4-phosphate cytidylyltransferase [Mogibacterium sp.]|nr:2-C-methyl-D-erythritol 4-phosphate cytidylyltransferase [Mogibacterium sp.]